MFENLFKTLLEGLGSDFFGKSANIITAVAPLFAAGFGIYVMMVAFNAYNRGMDDYILDIMRRTFCWLIIIACAFNASQYTEIAQALYTLPEFLSEAVNGQPYNGNVIDGEIEKFSTMIFNFVANGVEQYAPNWYDFDVKIMLNVFGSILVLIGYVFFGVIAAFYLVAKITLAMVLLTGPIFIGAMLFPATRQWGMNWIGQVLSYSLMVMFYVVIAAVQFAFYQSVMKTAISAVMVGKVTNGASAANVAFTALAMVPLIGMFAFAAFVFLVVAWNVPTMASALTGGASISGFSGVARGVQTGANMAGRGGEMAKNSAFAARAAYRRYRDNKISEAS